MTIYHMLFARPAPAGFQRVFFDGGYTETAFVTSTTQNSAKDVSTTETSGKSYMVFWQAILDNDSTASDAIVALRESGTTYQSQQLESQDVTDQHSVGGAYAYSGGTNKTFSLVAYEEANITSETENYSLAVLELDDLDLSNTSTAASNSTTSTYANKVSVVLASGEEYLIIASATLSETAVNVTKCRVFDGTNSYGETTRIYGQDVTNFMPYWHVFKITGSGQTMSIQWGRNATTGTATIRDASIIALRLNKFENNYYAEQPTAQSSTTTTVFGATGMTLSSTLANPNNYHILLGSAMLSHSSTATSALARLFNTSTSEDYIGTHRREANVVTTEYYPTVAARIIAPTQATNNISWQYYVSAASTATIRNMSICLLDTGIAIPAAANPVFQSAESAIGVGNTVTVTKPANIAVDDLLIASIAMEKGSSEIITATGWTLIRRENQTTNVGIGIYYKVAVSGDTGSGNFSFTLSQGSKWSAAVMRITNYNTTTPIAGNNGQNNGTATTSHVAPAITGSIAANALVLSFYSGKTQATYTPAASTTEMYDAPNTTDGQPAHMGAREIQATTGNTTARTATAATSSEYAAVQIAINPV